jgi:sulfur relay (sulfurtransferase) complex TusBCD TusD component (DsrE family)
MRVEKVKYQLVRLDSCETFAKRRGISVKQLTTWNSSIGSDCKKLWAKAYARVGVEEI